MNGDDAAVAIVTAFLRRLPLLGLGVVNLIDSTAGPISPDAEQYGARYLSVSRHYLESIRQLFSWCRCRLIWYPGRTEHIGAPWAREGV